MGNLSVAKPRHVPPVIDGIRIFESATIAGWMVKTMIPPSEVVAVLKREKIDYMLAGAYASAVWANRARATMDVDVLVVRKDLRRATAALSARFPELKIHDSEVVIRFYIGEYEDNNVRIDIMKPVEKLHIAAFKHKAKALVEGEECVIPTLELALAMKYKAIASPYRSPESKLQDGADFTRIVKAQPMIDMKMLADLAGLVHDKGADEILEFVATVRAGKTLRV